MNTIKPPHKKIFIAVLSLLIFFMLHIHFVTSQTGLTVQAIYQDVWDKASHQLRNTPWAGAQGVNIGYTEQAILQDVYDAVNHMLRTSNATSVVGSGIINVMASPYNCVGNGVADDTVCLQTALDTFSLSANKSGAIFVPVGVYKITSTLTYTGNNPIGIHWYGAVGGTRGPSGSKIVWAGASSGTMVYMLGANSSVIEHLEFLGGALAQVAIHIDATNADLGSGPASSGVILRHISVGGLTGAAANAVRLAHVPISGTNQISEVYIYDCLLIGDGVTSTSAGIKMMSTGNAKNYWISGGRLTGWGTGVDASNLFGNLTIQNMFFSNIANVATDIKVGTAPVTIIGVEAEAAGTRFVVGTTGSNPGQLTIIGSSWESSTPSDDVMISYSGNITLIGNTFRNGRTGSSLPRVEVANPLLSSAGTGSITSIGNFYQHAVSNAPFYDSSHNPFFVIGSSFNTDKDAAITSLGDMGGDNGAMTHLSNYLPYDATRPLAETFANLGTVAAAGSLRYCSDCTIANPCAGSGTGAIAKRLNGVWVCN